MFLFRCAIIVYTLFSGVLYGVSSSGKNQEPVDQTTSTPTPEVPIQDEEANPKSSDVILIDSQERTLEEVPDANLPVIIRSPSRRITDPRMFNPHYPYRRWYVSPEEREESNYETYYVPRPTYGVTSKSLNIQRLRSQSEASDEESSAEE